MKNYGGNFSSEPIRFVLTSQEYVGICCTVARYFAQMLLLYMIDDWFWDDMYTYNLSGCPELILNNLV